MKTTLFGGFAHHNSAIEGAKSSDLADQIFFFVSFLGKYPLTLFMITAFSVFACISGCSFLLVVV